RSGCSLWNMMYLVSLFLLPGAISTFTFFDEPLSPFTSFLGIVGASLVGDGGPARQPLVHRAIDDVADLDPRRHSIGIFVVALQIFIQAPTVRRRELEMLFLALFRLAHIHFLHLLYAYRADYATL